MRKSAIFLLALFSFAAPALAQRTVVSGTVKDVNGVAWAGGTIQPILSLPVGVSGATLNGAQINGTGQRVTLDSTGSFLMQLPDNNVVQPGGTQWTFNVNISPGAPPPLGTGPQSCSVTLTITGASQSISSSLSACPALSAVSSSGGATGALPTTYNVLNTPIASPFTGNLIVGSTIVNGSASVAPGAGYTGTCIGTITGVNFVSLEYATAGSGSTIAAPWTVTSGAWAAGVTVLQATSPTLAQSACTSAASLSVSTGSAVVSGQALVLAVRANTGNPATAVSGCGATWTEAGIRAPENAFDNNWLETWIGLNTSAGACTVTVTTTGGNVALALAVFNGVATTNAILDYNIATTGGSSATPSATTNPQSTYTAVNGTTGAIDCSGTDIAPVLNNCVFTNLQNNGTGGTVNFKASANPYLIKSFRQEGSNPNWYGIGFPSLSTLGYQYILIGESRPAWNGELGITTIATGGVVFLVSPQAEGTAYQNTGNLLSAMFVIGQSVAFAPSQIEIYLHNFCVRQVYNQLAGSIGINLSNAAAVEYDNVMTDYNEPYPTLGSAPAGVSSTYGMTTMQSGGSNFAHFKNTFATGSYYGYAVLTEHTTGESMTSIFSTYAGVLGPSTGNLNVACCLFHPMVFTKFTDQENINGWLYGGSMAQGTRVDWVGYDIETFVAGAFARSCNFSETNPGYTTGIITYINVQVATGITSVLPPGNEFCSGGQGYFGGMFSNAMEFGAVRYPGVDSGTRSGGTATGWGAAWLALGNSNLLCNSASAGATIASNAFVGTAKCSYAAVFGQTNQLAKATVASISSTSSVAVTVFDSLAGGTNQSRYEYICSTSGGLIAKRTINAVSATGVATALVATAANSGCGAGDVIELDVIRQDNGSNTLVAYYTPSGGSQTTDLVVTDSTLASGQPGMSIVTSAGAGTASNFSGGPLPAKNTTESIYTRPAFHPSYFTLTNCLLGGAAGTTSPAACGTAAAGKVAIPASQTTYTVNTTQVTANSEILVQQTNDNSGIATATCNTGATAPIQTSRVVGTSFTISLTSVASVTCIQYEVKN